MLKPFTFTVPGRLVPQQRHGHRAGGKGGFDTRSNRDMKERIGWHALVEYRKQSGKLYTQPVVIAAVFGFERGKTAKYDFPMHCDTDNLTKILCDGLESVVVKNDRLFVGKYCDRVFLHEAETNVAIWPLSAATYTQTLGEVFEWLRSEHQMTTP